jgi:asparagine synthetase B (glutamine-hydrolysing)
MIIKTAVLAEDALLRKLFKEMLYCTAVRGTDGTGIATVTANGAVKMFKRAIPSADFLDMVRVSEMIEDSKAMVLMGHCRASTIGSNSNANCHPFQRDGITMFHNGTVRAFRMLTKDNSITVDSDAICDAVSNAETPAQVMSEIDGAFSLAWYNEDEGTVNFARNDERPLYRAVLKGYGNTEIFASEPGLILWTCGRRGIEVEKIASTKENVIYTYPLNPSEKPSEVAFTPKPKNVYIGSGFDYAQYYPRGGTGYSRPKPVSEAGSESKSTVTTLTKQSSDQESLSGIVIIPTETMKRVGPTSCSGYDAYGRYWHIVFSCKTALDNAAAVMEYITCAKVADHTSSATFLRASTEVECKIYERASKRTAIAHAKGAI